MKEQRQKQSATFYTHMVDFHRPGHIYERHYYMYISYTHVTLANLVQKAIENRLIYSNRSVS